MTLFRGVSSLLATLLLSASVAPMFGAKRPDRRAGGGPSRAVNRGPPLSS